MMGTERRRIGIIGAGWVSAYHLPAWMRQSKRAEVVAIADPSLSAVEARLAAFDIARSYASAQAMLDAEQLDAVDICAPREFHVELVRLAAAKGLDIICQKPLAPSYGEAVDLLEGLSGRGRLMIHENWRFRAYYRRLKAWIDEELAGEIRQVQFEFLSSGMIADAEGKRPALVRQPFFRTQQRLLVMEVMIHHLDALRYLLGELEVVSARLERSNRDIVAEDVASVVLRRTSDGVLVTINANLAVHGAAPAPRDHLRIFGALGTLELNGNLLSAEGAKQRRESFDPDETYQGAYDATIAHFLDSLDGKVAMETSPDDNIKTLALVEDIYRLSRFDPERNPL
ncbi:Gfo/Idh/MocA family protein [Rhizobium leguminosarum]|uniref:Oxidoreductase domain protein n=1 Tax=Rhizobium leguminosarum bv. trifolii (strain WSM1325) TaxID=395491 RepID=C6AY46_RHILS|nr:Gfo/Idh/MocA family oxidoreductase [Rhizobium leguminosarum]ACS58195.1 oxidoreductase domain protein [Rhizobium leguminosarum bv. trifolii WSM1325]MBY2916418.1 Gfo/Idh/MocA family oxidoreductase [Rhizobium leguminosarum]MBY2923668.1 Gfo/Idh/MocA family oxidoreductase [Rhizobium leguminosarum]MBY2935184.1 Gfo/Idh/MocA family oxidoreductase [Rhizobium leguminosarum]MBY2939377.1 Gfo/Idh/MocA family oxidoreductase [Rhizobium leguminosarum]